MSHRIKAKKYWWILTDEYGWDLTTDKVRDFKISSLLDKAVENPNILYKMYIHSSGDVSTMSTLWVDLSKKLLSVTFFNPAFKARCESIDEAEDLIDEILETNSLVVAPANLKEY